VILLLLVFGISHLSLFRKPNTITIGNTSITKADISNYAAEIRTYQKQYPLNSFGGGTPTEVATNDLILNAGFKFEATQLHTSLTDSELVAPVKSAYPTAQEQQQYIQQLRSGPNFLLIRNENTAYELKFANKLLVHKQLLIAETSFDTPYINQASAATAKKLYAQELSKMNNQILPLFQKKESKETMATSKDFDVVAFGSHARNTQNYQQYFSKTVFSLSVLNNYLDDQTTFNDINNTSYIRGNVGKLQGTDAKIATLKNVGDYTSVFASKSGAFMIVRLEAKSGGPYTSWTDFLNYYKAKYAEPKVTFHISFSTGVVVNPINDFVASVTSIGEARADAYEPDCSAHDVRITAVSYDTSSQTIITGTGTTFQEYRAASNGLCPGEVVNTAVGDSSNGYTISDNCYGTEPTWAVNAFADPTHYNPVPGGPYYSIHTGQQQDNSVGGVPIAIRSASEEYTSGTPLVDANVYDGWPDWTPAYVNQVQHIDVYFEYKDKPPKCTVCGCPAITCPPQPSDTGVLNPTCSGVSGSAWVANAKYLADAAKGISDPQNSDYNLLSGSTWTVVWDTGGGTGPTVATGTMPGIYSNLTSYSAGYSIAGGGDAIYGYGQSPETLYVMFTSGTTDLYEGLVDTGTFNCQGVAPTGALTAQCGAVFLSGLNDNNAPGAPVNFSVTITSGGATQTINDSANGSAVEAFDIYNIGGQPPGLNGYSISLTVDDIPASNSGETSPNYSTSTSVGPCFSATCSLSVDTDLPTTTGGVPQPLSGTTGDVLANQQFTVTATITDTGPYLFSNLGGNPLGFTNNTGITDFPNYSATGTMPSINTSLASSGNDYASDFPFGSDIPPGVSSSTTMTYTAPNFTNGKTFTVAAYPDYYGRFGLVGNCSATVAVYQHFTLTGTSTTTPLDSSGNPTTDEDPSAFSYTTGVTSTAPVPVDVDSGYGSTVSTVYEIPQATGVKGYYNPPGTKTDSGAFAANANTNVLKGTASIRPPLEAGDKYYSEIDLGYTDAYVGPGGPDDIVDATGPTAAPSHITIENDPFFKVYGSGVYAGGSFSNIDSSCSGGGGLASWNNDTGVYPTSVDFGASAQFSALALGENIGFASAQTPNFERLPTALSFANTKGADISTDTYNPKLGGNFGATQCFTTQTQQANAVALPLSAPATANITGSLNGSYYHTGDLTLNAGQIGTGKNVSIFVKGNVYITGGSGITYQGSGNNTWALNPSGSSTVSNVPSFSLVVSGGSIYINPGIVELDGMYTAEPTSKTSTDGKIYTCAPGIGAITPAFQNSMFSTCKNQLTVYGNFVANEVKLMRTYGSLRDEAPIITSAYTPPPVVHTTYDYPVQLDRYTCGEGNVPNIYQESNWYTADYAGVASTPPPAATCPSPALAFYLGYIYAPNDSNFVNNYLNTNYNVLCEYQTGISTTYDHYMAHFPWTPGFSCANAWPAYAGYNPVIVGYEPNYPVAGTEILYENYDGPYGGPCAGTGCTGYHFYSAVNTAESDGGNVGYLYTTAAAGELSTTTSTPQPPVPESFSLPSLNCSNNSASNPKGTNGGRNSTPTCAAEVFDFSPELYLSNPAIAPTNNGGVQPTAITSLPPVL
jgi:hypothetical protein